MRVICRYSALGLLGISLSACMSLSPIATPPVNHYIINSLPVAKPITARTHFSLTVMPVTAVVGFDSAAMLYLSKPYQLAAFARNDWTAPPASMISSLLLTSLQQSQAFSAVIGPQAVGSTDLIFNTELLALYQDFTITPSQVVLTMQASLSEHSGKVLASEQFAAEVPASADNPVAGVTATNQAVQEVLSNIDSFVIRHTTGS